MSPIGRTALAIAFGLVSVTWGALEVRGGEPFGSATSARQLLEELQGLVDRRIELPVDNPAARLAWSTLNPSGWRFERLVDGHCVILAIDAGWMTAIRIAPRSGIEISYLDLTDASASPVHVRSMSEKHLSRINPAAHQLFFYFAGPTRAIIDQAAMPRSPFDLISR